MSKNILILGVNGFIGSSLSRKILDSSDWNIYGIDIDDNKLEECIGNSRFHFQKGDITVNDEWIIHHIKKCDIILPLVAIVNPALYVLDPIRVFELNFEANLKIIRQCVKYAKRVVFPSSSEVYGIGEKELHEENSKCILGPIHKQRWIYSCSKQLMERVIYAYGIKNNLAFTIFRPFNWLGAKLDTLDPIKGKHSRVVTQFLSNIIYDGEIKLVNGGVQQRSFTDIDDGIDAIFRIIKNQNGCANNRIFNIGNPKNNISIKELAEMLIVMAKKYPTLREKAKNTKITSISGEKHFGQYYEDANFRKPSVVLAKQYLNWEPKISLVKSLQKILDYHFKKPKNNHACHHMKRLTTRETHLQDMECCYTQMVVKK